MGESPRSKGFGVEGDSHEGFYKFKLFVFVFREKILRRNLVFKVSIPVSRPGN